MTFEDYQRNVRGVNDGSNFSVEYLVRIDRRTLTLYILLNIIFAEKHLRFYS